MFLDRNAEPDVAGKSVFLVFFFYRRVWSSTVLRNMTCRTLRVTLLASEWKSSKGGLSTMTRELAIHLAKHPNVSVSFFVPKCYDEDKRVASIHNVTILGAKERPGYAPAD